MALTPPIILLGRGGSGTRILSELAGASGIFLGNRLNKSGDSEEWIDLVYRMVMEVGGGYTLPCGPRYRDEIRECANAILESGNVIGETLWGWKLPETMLLVPLFIDAFPDAKIIHIVRNPILSSLRRSHMTSRLGNPIGDIVLPAAYDYAGRDRSLISKDETYLHNAYSWNYQVRRVTEFLHGSLNDRSHIELRYEDVCSAPQEAITNVRAFVGAPADGAPFRLELETARMGMCDTKDSRVSAIWEICGETAEALGYQLLP